MRCPLTTADTGWQPDRPVSNVVVSEQSEAVIGGVRNVWRGGSAGSEPGWITPEERLRSATALQNSPPAATAVGIWKGV